MTRYTHEEWTAEAKRRFGDDPMMWKFRCPACGHVAVVADWKSAGAPQEAVAFSCVGRWWTACRDAFSNVGDPGPCNYAGGGLISLNPVRVDADGRGDYSHRVFDFAD